MIIKKKNTPFFIIKIVAKLIDWYFAIRFNKIKIQRAEVKPNHSYLLMCNHFGFGDGFLAYYISFKTIYPHFNDINIMSLKQQLQQRSWLRYFGSFSINAKGFGSDKSLDHAAEILSKPGRILFFFPQGNMDSHYVRKIEFQEGLKLLVPKIKGNCQLIWSSNTIEYFESLMPSLYFDMLDCGTNHDFNFEELKSKVNNHHKQSIQNRFRFTKEN